MNEADFEGSMVLEQLAAIGKVDEFFDAVDSDDIRRAVRLMKLAGVDSETIDAVIERIKSG